MKRLFAGALALGLAACGGDGFSGDAKASYDLCMANGGQETYCACVTKDLQARLTPEAFTAVAKGEVGPDLDASLDEIAAADKACAAAPAS